MITAFQKTKLKLFFNIIDFDKNGYIEQVDFEHIGENIFTILRLPPDGQDAQLITASCKNIWQEVASYIDTNRDSKASFTEWLNYADEKIVNCNDEDYNIYVNLMVDKIFDLFDENKDNFISLDEYLNLFMALRLEIRYSAKAFTKMDTDHDEVISRPELKKAIREFFRSDNQQAKGNWLFGSWEELSI